MRRRALIAFILGLLALPAISPAQAALPLVSGTLQKVPTISRPAPVTAAPVTAAPVTAAPVTTLGGRTCRLIGVPLAAPVGLAGCGGVRPGGLVEVPAGQCSFNFMFRDNENRRYMGTAGHCVLDGPAEKTWSDGIGPPAKVDGVVIGEFVYAVLNDLRDFSLIRLRDGVDASAEMCNFGGPTGLAQNSAGPVVLHHVGHGIGVGTLPARTGLATSMTDPDIVAAVLAATPGDSGSAVIDATGGAVGVLVALEVATAGNGLLPGVGPVLITRIEPQRAMAANALGVDLSLQTAPLR